MPSALRSSQVPVCLCVAWGAKRWGRVGVARREINGVEGDITLGASFCRLIIICPNTPFLFPFIQMLAITKTQAASIQ